MRFAIFTHVEHVGMEGHYYAYEPYIREMNIWLNHVEEVEVVGPLPAPLPMKGELINKDAYRHPRLIFTKIPSFHVLNLKSAFQAILKIPIIIFKIAAAMKHSDHLHLRCPGNIGLLACICQIFFPHKLKTAKYAGNWDPEAKQPLSYKIQKWILSNTFITRNMTVLIYGKWPDQSKNILPFFTASFSKNEIQKNEKDFRSPYKFLFVGNLVPGKQPFFALELVESLKEKNINAELHVYGDGELMDSLKEQAGNKSHIHLHGNQPLKILKQAYAESHFLILASKSEGWPKVVAEAMFYRCIPVVTSVSCLPHMLNYGSRGILIPDSRVERGKWKEDSQHVLGKVGMRLRTVDSENVVNETVERIIELIKYPEEMKRMSKDAQEWSQEYTLEKFGEGIKEILKK